MSLLSGHLLFFDENQKTLGACNVRFRRPANLNADLLP